MVERVSLTVLSSVVSFEEITASKYFISMLVSSGDQTLWERQ